MANFAPEDLEALNQFVDNICSPAYAYDPSRVASIIDDFIRLVRELPDAVNPSYTDEDFSQVYRFLAEQPNHLRVGSDVLLCFAQNYSRLTRGRHIQYTRRELEIAHAEREHARSQLISLIRSRQATDNFADIEDAIDKHGAASERVREAAGMRADAEIDTFICTSDEIGVECIVARSLDRRRASFVVLWLCKYYKYRKRERCSRCGATRSAFQQGARVPRQEVRGSVVEAHLSRREASWQERRQAAEKGRERQEACRREERVVAGGSETGATGGGAGATRSFVVGGIARLERVVARLERREAAPGRQGALSSAG
ncbi:hypothetical protein LXA43DRAFT_1158199 [Ganoderma leucocontextum]|nr:hypothetical protein LXA43DRAFT_1158199 [Ganoderma leucocontextum]